MDVERANRSLFVQELLLSTFMQPREPRQTSSGEDGSAEDDVDRLLGLSPAANQSSVSDQSESSFDGKIATMNGPFRPNNGTSSGAVNQATGSSRIVSSVAASASISNEMTNAQAQNVIQNSTHPVRVAATMQRHPTPAVPSSQPTQAQPRVSDASDTNATGRL